MAETGAWILQFGPNDRAAVGQRELLHLAHAVETFSVPLAPAHCREVLYWQDRPVPLMDLAVWLRADAVQGIRKYVGIVGYQLRRGEAPRFGAFWLAAAPVQVKVSDRQARGLPETGADWREIAISCFEDKSGPVPVLDLPRLFSRAVGVGRSSSAQLDTTALQPLPV